MRTDPLIPNLAVVTDIRVDTPDVKTFRVVGVNGKKPFGHIPGQCAMLSVPGVGEALFSITSSPTEEAFVEFSIKHSIFKFLNHLTSAKCSKTSAFLC